jgi:hypothetical protein
MPSDRSRAPDPTRYGYTGVVAQQGRVVLDRDFNAQQGLTADRIAADALDFVGPVGTPDNGFAITLPSQQTSPPTFWSPPITVSTSPPETPGGAGDFLVSPGTMYVGGQRVCFPGLQNDQTITYSYFDQPDWPAPPAPSSPPPSFELVYLSVVEQEVSAVEDPDLFEVALAGPDTTQRLKLLSRVERRTVSDASCSSAWQTAIDQWAKEGWSFDPDTMQLKPSARLIVSFTNPGSDSDPCDPQASGGYLGADNQLIRLRVDRGGGKTSVLWGYDNASFIYRIAQVTDRDTLTLAADPPDQNHFPVNGQWVEILTTASVLSEEPDESDPLHQAQILRVVAEPEGSVRRLGQPYGPLPGGVTNVIVLSDPLPAGVADSPLPLFLRVWQARLPVDPGGGAVTLETTTTSSTTGASPPVSTGVVATLSGGPLADGVFWEIAVRPSTPQGVYPEDLLTAPQPPVGPRRWVCPLAVIDWANAAVTDCRSQFQGLVELSRRKPGCCSVSIGPSDVTAGASLQTLIDRAAALAERVTVCLQPGVYSLPGTLYLDRRHAGLTLEGCGGLIVLTNQALDDLTPFLDGIIAVERASDITLQGLTLRPPIVEASEAFFRTLLDRLAKDGFAEAAKIFRRPFTSFGIRALSAPQLTIEDCDIIIEPTVAGARTADVAHLKAQIDAQLTTLADVFAAAIFLQGACTGAKIADCSAISTLTPTYTPLMVDAKAASPVSYKAFSDLLTAHLAQPLVAQDVRVQVASTSPPGAEPTADEVKAMRAREFLAVPASPPPSASPPASPPSEVELLDRQVNDSLNLVMARRLAVGVVQPRFAIITVGVLAARSLDGAAVLGNAILTDCRLEGFTFATWFSAEMAILRLQDNTVTNGVAGLWLEVIDAIPVPGASDRTPYYQSMILFEEYMLLLALTATFPAPAPPRAVRSLSLNRPGQEDLIASPNLRLKPPPPYALVISGNQIDVRQQTSTLGASAALLLALYREGPVQPLTSIMVQSNRLCGGSSSIRTEAVFARDTPAALITLPASTSCAVNGNVVINRGGIEAGLDAVAPSLWLTVAFSSEGADQLAVTGNVLKGATDLIGLRRSNRGDANWSIYNADPS